MADLVLSSGFLAFSRHVGFLQAVEASGTPVDAVVGTSSGAMVGALWAAGMTAHEVGAQIAGSLKLSEVFQINRAPWRGLFSLEKVTRKLAEMLPPTFEGLRVPFAVGVAHDDGHRLLTAGPLAPAVAASCAMPRIFSRVDVAGVSYFDGGAVDRLGLEAWRSWRPDRTALVHHVERTAGVDVEADLSGLTVVRTPRSRASFFSLQDFDRQVEEARAITAEAIGVTEDACPA